MGIASLATQYNSVQSYFLNTLWFISYTLDYKFIRSCTPHPYRSLYSLLPPDAPLWVMPDVTTKQKLCYYVNPYKFYYAEEANNGLGV